MPGRKPRRGSATAAQLEIRTLSGLQLPIAFGKALESAAMKWNYIARNRQRWSDQVDAREDLYTRARAELAALLATGPEAADEALERLVEDGVVEISIPWSTEEQGWAARIMPWEYLLSAATSRQRSSGGSFVVVRHLRCEDDRVRPRRIERALALTLAPGRALGLYDFSEDADLPRRLTGGAVEKLENPTRDALRAWIEQNAPDAIHVMGLDVHEYDERFDVKAPARRDGVLLSSGEEDAPDVLRAEDFADLLNAADASASLVVLNLYNGAARIAPMIVAGGVPCALAFQDTFDDLAAEILIAGFYDGWNQAGGDALEAFRLAWAGLRSAGRPLEGSGVVLWSAHSLLERAVRRPRSRARGASIPASGLTGPVRRVTSEDFRKALKISVKPSAGLNLNYALLHNRRPVFEELRLHNLSGQPLEGVLVLVRLDLGSQRLEFKRTYDIDQPWMGIEQDVTLPLFWQAAEPYLEGVRTHLAVSASCDGHLLDEQTIEVTLLPRSEWSDTDDSRHFLPSFVVPTDPGVQRIIGAAQPYLMSLADDPAAGFDGYQCIDEHAEDPTLGVDHQVKAIWSALLHEWSIYYIEPPPTYTPGAQRLRTPIGVLDEGRGTCIDLALLFCSCLEYIGMKPTMFLFEGHAFPGYWRSDADWSDFFSMAHLFDLEDEDVQDMLGPSSTRGGRDVPWLVPRSQYEDVRIQIEQGRLVPLETVLMTSHQGLDDAMDAGWENMRHASEFESMIDIGRARRVDPPITPLPRALRASR